jgi:hypothetical protein
MRVTQTLENRFLPNQILRIPILDNGCLATFANDRSPFTQLFLNPKMILTFPVGPPLTHNEKCTEKILQQTDFKSYNQKPTAFDLT